MYGDHPDLHVLTHAFPTRRSSDLFRHQQHGATRGVAAKQRALRTLQHLHVFEIEQLAGAGTIAGSLRALATRRDHVGEVDADRRRGAQILREAADRERGAVRAEALVRSEEHTSELQSLMRISYAVFCLKKKTHKAPTST